MNEAEWLAITDPAQILYEHRRSLSERQRKLYECACCRRVWHEFADVRSQQAVIAAERHADGFIDDEALEIAANLATEVEEEQRQRELGGERYWPFEGLPLPFSSAAYNVAIPMGWWGGAPAFEPPSSIIRDASSDATSEAFAQSILIRDIFGNPFRPVAIEPAWRTETVVGIARGIYDDRAFERMPILADALQDAGCEHPDILTHCREPGVHVRGCWVVDLVLGKE